MITPEEIKALRLRLGRSRLSMAAIVGTTLMTIGRWERGDTTPMRIFEHRLRKLEEYAEQKEWAEENK